MKTNKFLTLILGIVAVFAITSCVQDDDYVVPGSLGNEENALLQNLLNGTATVNSISQVKALYVNEGEPTEIVSDIYMKGYVTSSDASGNFFKEFFMQDSPSNPTAAIKIVLDQVDSYNQFNIGREVYVNLKGLYVGETRAGDGVTAIGGKLNDENDEVEALNNNKISNSLLRSNVTETLIPLPVSLNGINGNNVGMYVIVENAFFYESGANGFPYADPNETFDTQRTLKACDGFDFAEFILETSSFANFKQEIIPSGGGTVAGVVSKTFNGSDFVLALNTTDDVNLGGAICTPLDINDFTINFEEDFESFSGFTNEGWTNVNISGTSTDWFISGFNNNDYARISAFNSNNSEADVWLVTPTITLPANSNSILTFDLEIAFSNGIILTPFISEDFTGDPTTATWQPLDVAIPFGPNVGFGGLQPTGNTDISAFSGDVHIGFFYEGSDPSATTRYHIDNLRVLSN